VLGVLLASVHFIIARLRLVRQVPICKEQRFLVAHSEVFRMGHLERQLIFRAKSYVMDANSYRVVEALALSVFREPTVVVCFWIAIVPTARLVQQVGRGPILLHVSTVDWQMGTSRIVISKRISAAVSVLRAQGMLLVVR
jgi:hypothetical protein